MSMPLPGVTSSQLSGVRFLVDNTRTVHGNDVVLDSGNTDAGSTPTSRFRPGNVIVKRTSTGRYVEADDTNGDRCTAPSVVSAEDVDGDWKGKTITLTLNGAAIVTVTLDAGDDDKTKVVTSLNASGPFRANALASADGNKVKVTALQTGADVYLKVTSNLATAFGANGQEARGTDADYRVTAAYADLAIDGSAVHAPVATILRGNFDVTKLVNLTDEAAAVFSRNPAVG